MKGLRRTVLTAAVTVATATPAAERDDFILHCAGCHRFDGSGSEAVPALDDIGAMFALDGGRQYLVRVPGVAQAPVSDHRLAVLLNWLLAEFAEISPQPPYEAEEVGALRARPLRDPVAARNALSGD